MDIKYAMNVSNNWLRMIILNAVQYAEKEIGLKIIIIYINDIIIWWLIWVNENYSFLFVIITF